MLVTPGQVRLKRKVRVVTNMIRPKKEHTGTTTTKKYIIILFLCIHMTSKRIPKLIQIDPTPRLWLYEGDGLVVDLKGKPVARLAEHDEAGDPLPEAERNRMLIMNAQRLYSHCREALKLLNDSEVEAARNVLEYASDLVDCRVARNR